MRQITIDLEGSIKVGDNVEMVKKDNLTMFIINEDEPTNTLSKSGKSMTIANTGGMQRFDGLLLNFWYGRKL